MIPAASRSRRARAREAVVLLFLTGFGALAALLALEAAARLIPLWPDADVLSGFDPQLGVAHRPNAAGWWINVNAPFEFRTYVTLNASGMRGPEVALEKAPGSMRLLFLGDSMTEGLEVPLEATFASSLERRLQASGDPVEVVNGSHWGYGTDQELLYYRLHGRAYRPDAVVLFFFPGNDVDNNVRAQISGFPKPYFVLAQDGSLSLKNYPAALPAQPAETSLVERFKQWLYAHSKLYRVAAYHIKAEAPALRDLLAGLGLVDAGGGRKSDRWIESLGTYQVPLSEEQERGWDVTAALVTALRDEVEADGAKLLVVTLADPRQLSPAAQGGSWDLTVWNRRMQELCDQAGLDCVDLLSTFLESGPESEGVRLFYAVDGHLTAAGHERVAEALLDQLDSRLADWEK